MDSFNSIDTENNDINLICFFRGSHFMKTADI